MPTCTAFDFFVLSKLLRLRIFCGQTDPPGAPSNGVHSNGDSFLLLVSLTSSPGVLAVEGKRANTE